MVDFKRDLADDDDDGGTLASSPVRVSWRVAPLDFASVRVGGIEKESGGGVYILYIYGRNVLDLRVAVVGCGFELYGGTGHKFCRLHRG